MRPEQLNKASEPIPEEIARKLGLSGVSEAEEDADVSAGEDKEALEWNGDYVLFNDGDVWHAVESFGTRFGDIFVTGPEKNAVNDAAVEVAGEYIDSFLGQREYLLAGFDDRNDVKRLGAYFDYDAKAWFIPENCTNPAKFAKYRHQSWELLDKAYPFVVRKNVLNAETEDDVVFLEVPFQQKEAAKAAGAAWSPEHRAWVVSKKGPFRFLWHWLPNDFQPTAQTIYLPPDPKKPARLLKVPRDEQSFARHTGAIYLESRKAWYVQGALYNPSVHYRWVRTNELIGPRLAFGEALWKTGFSPVRPENSENPFRFDGEYHRYFVWEDKDRPSSRYRGFITHEGKGMLTAYFNNYSASFYKTWTYPIAGLPWEEMLDMPLTPRFMEILNNRMIEQTKRLEEKQRAKQTQFAGRYLNRE